MADDEDVPEHTEPQMDLTDHPPEAPPQPQPSQSRGTSCITPGKTYQGVPFEQIEELSSRHSQVPVRIQRRNARGQLATLEGSLTIETRALLDIEVWLKPKHGGGTFHVEVRDPIMPAQRIFSFDFTMEGLPYAAAAQMNVPAAPNPYGTPLPPAAPPAAPPGPLAIPAGMPNRGWVEGLLPNERAAVIQSYMAQHGMMGAAPMVTHASDQIALEVEARTRAELQKTREASERRQRELEAEIEKMRTETAKAREEAKEAAHQAELRALAAKIDAMSTRPAEKGMADTIAALAPLVPLGIAYLQSNAQQAQAQLQHQQAGFQTMIAAATPKQQDSMKEILTTLGPLFLPLISKSFDRDSPESQAKLFQALAESQMSTVSMMAQLVQESAPPPPSPLGAAIQQGLEGIKNVALAYITSQGGLPGQLPGARPAGVLRAAAQPVGGGYSTIDETPETPPVRGEVVDVGDAQAAGARPAQQGAPKPPPPELEALFSMLPGDFQSAEWRLILSHLHTDPPMDATQIANLLCGHLEHLMNFGMLPSMLSGIRTQPRETLEAVLEKLPVAMAHPEYAAKVLDLTLGMLMEDRYVPQPQAQPESEEAAGDGEEDDGDEAAAEE